MPLRSELLAFAATLAAIVAGFFAQSLFGGKVLSPADVLRVSASFRDEQSPSPEYEPKNRLLMDPVLQFQPWLEFNRAMLRSGRLPLWNDHAGCGVPHLANGQSAVFDPFHLIAYAGSLPAAYAWMAAARLWVAGMGMFLLARCWGLGRWGRWFAGLAFPFCGFLVVWLLFPVTNVAVWMPWLFLAVDRVLRIPSARSIGATALVTGLVLLGGHVQTSAHVLLAGGLYAIWRTAVGANQRGFASQARRPGPFPGSFRVDGPESRGDQAPLDCREPVGRAGLAAWVAASILGVVVAAVEVVPLAAYLGRSSVWSDRARETPSAWRITRPRLLGAICTALPYAFGSQRRGHPHLGRALGVHNLNESAGGFVGLATLIWLVPTAWSMRRRIRRVGFLAALSVFGAMGAFGIPPVDNLLRALPVLGVTDNRRLTLWLAFGLVLLGGIGLDGLLASRRRLWTWPWIASALVLLAACAGVGRLEPMLQHRASAHYARAAESTSGADPTRYLERARQQVRTTLAFLPRYYGLAAVHLMALSGLAWMARRGGQAQRMVRPLVLGLTLADLLGFGLDLNPAIARSDDRPEPPLIAYLRREVPPPGRVLGLGAELPPNVLMRYGLDDPRNYDSVELARSLRWFAPLYEPDDRSPSSRRDVIWAGVIRARERLYESSVRAVVSAVPPPAGSFRRVDRVGAVWVARLDAAPWAGFEARSVAIEAHRMPGEILINYELKTSETLVVRDIYDRGWRAEIDGRPVPVSCHRGVFLAVEAPAGRHRVTFHFDPPEVRAGLWASGFGLCAVVFALTAPARFRSTRIIADGLGRTQAAGLESVCALHQPNTEG